MGVVMILISVLVIVAFSGALYAFLIKFFAKKEIFEVKNIRPKLLPEAIRKSKYEEAGLVVEEVKVKNINQIDKEVFEVFTIEREKGNKNKVFVEWFGQLIKGEIPFKVYISESEMYLLFQKNILNIYGEEKRNLEDFIGLKLMKRI